MARTGREAVAVECEGDRVAAVVCSLGGGARERVRARVVVDATFDGDVAALARAPYDQGAAEDGGLQPATQVHTVEDTDYSAFDLDGLSRRSYGA